jgi:hypothetical protein
MCSDPLAYFIFTPGYQLLRIMKTRWDVLDEGNRHGIYDYFVVYFALES